MSTVELCLDIRTRTYCIRTVAVHLHTRRTGICTMFEYSYVVQMSGRYSYVWQDFKNLFQLCAFDQITVRGESWNQHGEAAQHHGGRSASRGHRFPAQLLQEEGAMRLHCSIYRTLLY